MILFIKDTVDDQVICETRHKLQKKIAKEQVRKERKDKAPARDKAPSKRRLRYVSESLKKDLLAIIS